MSDKPSFWNFRSCDKYDELLEDRHDYLIQAAMSDWQTGVDKVDPHTFILFGKDEALLFRPVKFIYRLGVELLEAFLSLKS